MKLLGFVSNVSSELSPKSVCNLKFPFLYKQIFAKYKNKLNLKAPFANLISQNLQKVSWTSETPDE